MQVLTPSGYRDPSSLADGDQVCAFDASGAAILNAIETIGFVDYGEWCRWWSVEDAVPSYDWYRINGSYLLFREQSVWRNGASVCHARDLVVGDTIYDDHDDPVVVTDIARVTDVSLVWYRFDISGDHSYIVDGVSVHNAGRYWVGGTGSVTPTNTTNWAATSGGAGGQSVPGAADTATWDANSGGGTCTLNYGGTWTLQSISNGAYTGTWDNSVNNNNITLSSSFNGSGTGTRTVNLGSATYTMTSAATLVSFSSTTGLTFSGSSSIVAFNGGSSAYSFFGGGLTFGTLSLGATSGTGYYQFSGSNTFGAVNITAPCYIVLPPAGTQTISTAFNWSGSSTAQIGFVTSTTGSSPAVIAAAAGSTASYCAFREMTFTGSPTATNSFDLGHNSGISISGPAGGGGGSSGSFSATIF